MERLLREYRQNQKLVQNIGAHYYQIIYPVQLRHHEKMGISTREVGAPKVRKARSTVCFHQALLHFIHYNYTATQLQLHATTLCIFMLYTISLPGSKYDSYYYYFLSSKLHQHFRNIRIIDFKMQKLFFFKIHSIRSE